MRRNFSTALLAICFLLTAIAPTFAQAPYGVIRNAKALLGDACKLHSLLKAAGADPYTFRSACRLESAAEQLLEKLSCPRSQDQVPYILDECSLWYNRTSSGIRHDCRLNDSQIIRATIANAGRQLSAVQDGFACHLRDSRPIGHPFGQPFGHPNHSDDYRWGAPQIGGPAVPLPGRPSNWNQNPMGDNRSPSFPFGPEGFGRPNFGQPNFPNSIPSHIAPRISVQPTVPSERREVERREFERREIERREVVRRDTDRRESDRSQPERHVRFDEVRSGRR